MADQLWRKYLGKGQSLSVFRVVKLRRIAYNSMLDMPRMAKKRRGAVTRMVSQFKPTWMVKNIYDLTPAQLRANGIKVILTDLDNTLIAWNNPDGTPELRHWLTLLELAGIRVIVVSNNNRKRCLLYTSPSPRD